ncbi:MAG: S8 family serine peptidase [Nitrospira sp.]|nr:S8 family serine peptidase [Nitrospira sp.]
MPPESLRASTRKQTKKKDLRRKSGARWPTNYVPRVVVKFYPDMKIPDKDSTFQKYLKEGKLGPWKQLLKSFPEIRMQRLVTRLSPRRCRLLADKTKSLDGPFRPAKLENYFVVECPSSKYVEGIAKKLDAWNTTEIAYIEGGPTPSPLVNRAGNLPFGPRQTYLGPAPDGIDAEYAWTMQGGDGSGVSLRFADVEQGWHLNHQDLPAGIQLIHGVNQDLAHGTAVLGIVAAQDNGIGCVGITPYIRTKMVSSIWPDPDAQYPDRYQAILAAIEKLDYGDVMLLELQVDAKGYYPGQDKLDWYQNLPVEVDPLLFELIQTATFNKGIIVVEAAGNGGLDLDQFDPYAAPHWGKDSGAIMVAAVDAPAGRSGYVRVLQSNYGSRINCFAWGSQICVPYDLAGPQTWVSGFGYTSGASAIIAGAALAVQGYAKSNLNRTLSADEMRSVLSNATTATHSENSTQADPNADRIGVMPDLRAIIDEL